MSKSSKAISQSYDMMWDMTLAYISLISIIAIAMNKNVDFNCLFLKTTQLTVMLQISFYSGLCHERIGFSPLHICPSTCVINKN